jgi:HD-GYP domain-containing protein (c-di-GMP phosphodiesterase class II)
MLRISDLLNREKQKPKDSTEAIPPKPSVLSPLPSAPSVPSSPPPLPKQEPEEPRVENAESNKSSALKFPQDYGGITHFSRKAQTIDAIYDDLLPYVKILFDQARTGSSIYLNEAMQFLEQLPRTNPGQSDMMMPIIERHSHENYLYSHSIGVSVFSAHMGRCLGLSDDAVRDLMLAGLLHDLGMTGEAENLSVLPRPLTFDEKKIISKHPMQALEQLKGVSGISRDALDAIVAHHEREDGSGYPRALKGHYIPISAKILGICDSYIALTHPRSYRRALGPAHAIKILVEGTDKLFDRRLIKALVNELSLYPRGSFVRLNTNESGIVEHTNPQAPLRPIILITHDASFQKLPEPRRVDLLTQPLISIKELAAQEME